MTLWQTWNCWRRKTKPKFLDIDLENENNIKKRIHTIFNILIERGSFSKSEARKYEDECIEDEEEITHPLDFSEFKKK